jgi:hypothetical protein
MRAATTTRKTARTKRLPCFTAGNVVDIEHWRVQVRRTSDSPRQTFELRRDPLSEQWLLEVLRCDMRPQTLRHEA